MKFNVNINHKNGSRLGLLSDLRSSKENKYETPYSLTVTRKGGVPHLTQDVYHSYFGKETIICASVQQTVEVEDVLSKFQKGITKFVALPTHPVCVVVQDPCEETPSGYNESTSVSVWTSIGRMKITMERFCSLMLSLKPDWYECLNDADTDADCSQKRLYKSRINSQKYFEKCLQFHRKHKELEEVGILAPLLGGSNVLERRECGNQMKALDVDGFVLLGLHRNGRQATDNTDAKILEQCVKASLETIPVPKMRVANGAFCPQSVLLLVRCGVDVFDSSLAVLSAERGCALYFPNTLADTNDLLNSLEEDYIEELSPQPLSVLSSPTRGRQTPPKRFRIGTSGEATIASTEKDAFPTQQQKTEDPMLPQYFEIDILQAKYARRKEPLLAGCTCYTCANFSSAYVHHLLSVREMLASILLMVHNLYHWETFFCSIRDSIREDQLEFLQKNIEEFKNKRRSQES